MIATIRPFRNWPKPVGSIRATRELNSAGSAGQFLSQAQATQDPSHPACAAELAVASRSMGSSATTPFPQRQALPLLTSNQCYHVITCWVQLALLVLEMECIGALSQRGARGYCKLPLPAAVDWLKLIEGSEWIAKLYDHQRDNKSTERHWIVPELRQRIAGLRDFNDGLL